MSALLAEHIVPHLPEAMKLSDYLPLALPAHLSKKGAKKALKRGDVLVDGKAAISAIWVQQGQCIQLFDTRPEPKIYELPLEIIFEDEHLAIIHKPAGIEVSGNQFRTVQNALNFNLQASKQEGALSIPRPVHRLDYATSGLLIVAKTAVSLQQLGSMLEHNKIQKTYTAILNGQTNKTGSISAPLDGKTAQTNYETLQSTRSLKCDWLSLVKVQLITGRTHQIRRHFDSIGHPVVGDTKYSNDQAILKGKGLFLSATALEFVHPVLHEPLSFSIAPPNKFHLLMQREQRRWEKFKGA